MSERLDTFIKFPIDKTLKFTKIFSKAIQGATLAGNEKYEIKAVVQHKNSNISGSGGHYVSCCYDSTCNEWWRFDDSIIKELAKDKPEEIYKDSYMLVYQKVRQSSVPP